jgi:hypothetical protein
VPVGASIGHLEAREDVSKSFIAQERRFKEDRMTPALFAVATALSIVFALMAYWQQDDEGGLT